MSHNINITSKRAMVDQSVDKVLKKEGIKIWGSFPTGRDAALGMMFIIHVWLNE